MKRQIAIAAALFLTTTASHAIFAQEDSLQDFFRKQAPPTEQPAPKTRIEQTLEQTALQFSVDDDGDFHVGFMMDEEQPHSVWVFSKTTELGSIQLRTIFSPVHTFTNPPSAELMAYIMQFNSQVRLGAIAMEMREGALFVYFRANLVDNLQPGELEIAIREAANAAFFLRKELESQDSEK